MPEVSPASPYFFISFSHLLPYALSVSLARSGLRAGVAHVGLFFRFFSLLFSHLVFIGFFMLFLSTFRSILRAKIVEKTIKNEVSFLTFFWKAFSLIFDLPGHGKSLKSDGRVSKIKVSRFFV